MATEYVNISLFLGVMALWQVGGLVRNTKSGTKASTSKVAKKGSFLLNAQGLSDAAKIISGRKQKASGSQGDASSQGENEKLGRALIAQRDAQMGPNVSVFYKQDGGLVIESGSGSYMIDADGNKHLDCCNNVASVGHAHPAVVKAGSDELGKIQTNGRFLHPTRQRYLKKLLATFPVDSGLDTVYLVNSGSEANDLALRIARAHAESNRAKSAMPAKPLDVIVLDVAYHGHTQALIDISPYKWYQAVDGKEYCPTSTHVVSLPDSYRGKYRGYTQETGLKYAQEVEQVVASTGGVGVFIAESIVGCGGQIVLPPGYLQACYKAVRAKGGVCIADEVQTGFARAGTHFWNFEAYGVVPDIVTMGKPMGNGYPVAAVVCRKEVAKSFAASGIEYFNTYGGNSVACAIAEAVLDTIQKEQLQENARKMGEYIQEVFQPLVKKYDWVGDVRGMGLFQGVEFVKSKSSDKLEPYPELTKFVVDFMRYEKVIISRDGPDENVIKIKPPLVFSKADVDLLVSTVDQALQVAVDSKIF